MWRCSTCGCRTATASSVCRDIRSKMPEVACLMLTSFGDDEALFDAIMAGRGRVRAQADPGHRPGRRGAHRRLRRVDAGPGGGQPGDEADARAGRRVPTRWPALTGQERKILELIGEGLTNRQIGERLFLAEKTVKNYVSALFAKLGMERSSPGRCLCRAGVRRSGQARGDQGGLNGRRAAAPGHGVDGLSGTRQSSTVPPLSAGPTVSVPPYCPARRARLTRPLRCARCP